MKRDPFSAHDFQAAALFAIPDPFSARDFQAAALFAITDPFSARSAGRNISADWAARALNGVSAC